ncbi:hypothetical protein JKF63_03051 [Porcisia hertigi]|uniref:Uncharacterized protein n=1 Tax=Porcisia hertigi TaxID=2761500 RepID=A0A836INI4_9TRYP|nr:hypothetical protein JKF63_03051 [Porcisia hertigi]
MNVDTLLTRQMELYISLREPPKSPQELMQLMGMMKNYKHFFESLRSLAGRFSVEPETIFQSFMYISVGGTVSFDRQHQDGAVPMHQAKVLARSNAIELAPKLCKELPNPELMVYVGLSRDLRNTLRVKVEDGNDLKTAEKSVCEAVEYLNCIYSHARRNPEKLYAIYMAEDPSSLASLLSDAELSMTASSATFQETLSSTNGGMQLPAIGDGGSRSGRELAPLPSPLTSFTSELKKHCASASDVSSANGGASRRLKASQVLLDWVQTVPEDYLSKHLESILGTVVSTLALLAAEKRSALCRIGCDIIIVLMQRLSWEPALMEDLRRGAHNTNPTTISGALSLWVSSLTKGIYVTIAAISSATDTALRVIAIQSHGHMGVVNALLKALSGGAQTELRRKCLGYLALCVVAAHQQVPERMQELVRLVGPIAVKYASNGDSPSRKMARALFSVLRFLDPAGQRRDSDTALHIADERTKHLVQQERPQVEAAVLGGPEKVEELLFEANTFVSSLRSVFSVSSQRSLAGSTGGRTQGMCAGASKSAPREHQAVAAERRRRDCQRASGTTAGGAREKSALSAGQSEGADADADAAAVESDTIGSLSAPQNPIAHDVPHPLKMTEPHSSTLCAVDRCGAPASASSLYGGFSSASALTTQLPSPHDPSPQEENTQFGMIYDSEAFLGGLDSIPKGPAKRTATEEVSRRSIASMHTVEAHAPLRGSSDHGCGPRTGHTTTPAASSGGAHHLVFPALVPAPRRATHVNPPAAEEEGDGALLPPHGVSAPRSERLFPFSLRSHGSHDRENAHRGSAYRKTSNDLTPAGPNATHISLSPHRKNKENKSTMRS